MKTKYATSKNGNKVMLSTCDTYTLAIGKERAESTPAMLARIFSKRTLQTLLARTSDQSEQSKLAKAIRLAN